MHGCLEDSLLKEGCASANLPPTLLQGDITDENFVQSVVENVTAFHVTNLQLACVILFQGSP